MKYVSLAFSLYEQTASPKNELKLDIRNMLPIQVTEVLANTDYSLERMKRELKSIVMEAQGTGSRGTDALLVSIPDDRLKDSIQEVKDAGIPVVAVYTGLQAAQDLDILAVMPNDFESGRIIGEQLVNDGKNRESIAIFITGQMTSTDRILYLSLLWQLDHCF